jgi:hypothetical protein
MVKLFTKRNQFTQEALNMGYLEAAKDDTNTVVLMAVKDRHYRVIHYQGSSIAFEKEYRKIESARRDFGKISRLHKLEVLRAFGDGK